MEERMNPNPKIKPRLLILCLSILLCFAGNVPAEEPKVNISFAELMQHKQVYDDTTPIYEKLPVKDVVTPKVYASVTFDAAASSEKWAQAVGFKAPDIVGKIAPQIKPGEYSYDQKESLPFKELMIPDHYARFAPGAPPHIGNFSKIKVVPTRQYYWALPIAKASLENSGKTQQDDRGYIKDETYKGGYPFPKPSGKFKAIQVMYNWEKRYTQADNYTLYTQSKGFDKNLNEDFSGLVTVNYMRLQGRLLSEPFGWYDDRARERGELTSTSSFSEAPRDLYGNVLSLQSYVAPDKDNMFLMYINGLRRARKLSGSDTQDPMGGQDLIYEDADGFNQKISPDRYPYIYEVVGEREFLIPAYTLDGATTIDSKTKEFANFEFERRPLYVLKLTQQDENFVYGQRTIYVDKETFIILYTEAYDQKGNLYRTINQNFAFFPEQGMFIMNDFLARDHLDLHSTYIKSYGVPAPNLTRDDFSLKELAKRGK
jgi:hypothetical protein